MKIHSIQIKNYKSILDSTEIHLEDKLTIFIGKNESGKSNILQAIRDINNLEDENYKLYPYHNKNLKPMITLKVSLEDVEQKNIYEKYSINLEEEFKIEIEIGNKKTIILEKTIWKKLDEPFCMEFKKETGSNLDIDFDESDRVRIQDTFEESSQDMVFAKYDMILEKRNKFLDELEKDLLFFIPKIKYLSTMENTLPQKINSSNVDSIAVTLLADFIKKQSGNRYDNDIFKEILKTKNSQERKRLCDNISKVLTRFFEENYKQYKLKFDLTPSENDIDIFVKDYFKNKQDDGMGLYLDQRSTGLNWFVSFVITCNSFNRNEIFVLDEPGMYLHLEGQQDMFSILKKISEERQIIICTHSPYLIDVNMIPIIRLVEKVPTTLEEQHFEETIVYKNLHSFKDSQTIQTLCAAIGFNISKGLTYHHEKALLVEGISDLLLIQSFAKIIGKELDFDIYFAKSSSKMDIMYALLSGLGIKKIVALFDKDAGGLSAYKDMPYIQNYSVFTHPIESDVLEGKKRLSHPKSIEDILTKEDFNKNYLNNNKDFVDDSKLNSEIAKIKNSKYLDSKIMLDKTDRLTFSQETKNNIKQLFEQIDQKFDLYNQ